MFLVLRSYLSCTPVLTCIPIHRYPAMSRLASRCVLKSLRSGKSISVLLHQQRYSPPLSHLDSLQTRFYMERRPAMPGSSAQRHVMGAAQETRIPHASSHPTHRGIMSGLGKDKDPKPPSRAAEDTASRLGSESHVVSLHPLHMSRDQAGTVHMFAKDLIVLASMPGTMLARGNRSAATRPAS